MPLVLRYFWNWTDALRALTELTAAGLGPPRVRVLARPVAGHSWRRTRAAAQLAVGSLTVNLLVGALLVGAWRKSNSSAAPLAHLALVAGLSALVWASLALVAFSMSQLFARQRPRRRSRQPRFVVLVRAKGHRLAWAWDLLGQGRPTIAASPAGHPAHEWIELALLEEAATIATALETLKHDGYREEISYASVFPSARLARLYPRSRPQDRPA